MEPSAREFSYTGSARIFKWYDVHDSDHFQCPCGWSGRLTELVIEGFKELVDGSCPNCGQMLMIRGFPTLQEVRQAAARGDPGAVEELSHIEAPKDGPPEP